MSIYEPDPWTPHGQVYKYSCFLHGDHEEPECPQCPAANVRPLCESAGEPGGSRMQDHEPAMGPDGPIDV